MLKNNLLIALLLSVTSWSQSPDLDKIKTDVFAVLYDKGVVEYSQKDSINNLFLVYRHGNDKSRSLQKNFYTISFKFNEKTKYKIRDLVLYDSGIVLYFDFATYKSFIQSYKKFLFYAKTKKLCGEELCFFSNKIIYFYYMRNKHYGKSTYVALDSVCRYRKIINSKYTPNEVREILMKKNDIIYSSDLDLRKLFFSKKTDNTEKGLYIVRNLIKHTKDTVIIISNEIEYLSFDTYKLSVDSLIKVLDFCEENNVCSYEINSILERLFYHYVRPESCYD